jgi:hypothetical protein
VDATDCVEGRINVAAIRLARQAEPLFEMRREAAGDQAARLVVE